MREMKMFGCWAIILALVGSSASIELTFELPDNANQCFYEEINKTTSSTLEFQVVTGGQYDVDVTIENPLGQVLYKEIRKQYDSHTWTAETDGVYQVCFSNEFSTFSHKIIYMDWQVGSDSNLPNRKPSSATAMTMIESSALSIHERLKVIDDYQTHNRLREATDRTSAEDLNDRVLWWSVGQSIIVMVLGISQVFVLRSFFSDRASRR